MKYIVHTDRFCLTDEGTYGRLEMKDLRLAAKINRFLKYYENGEYAFRPHDEPVFRIPPNQIPSLIEHFLAKKRKPWRGSLG